MLRLSHALSLVLAFGVIPAHAAENEKKAVEQEYSASANSQGQAREHSASKTYSGSAPIDLSRGPLFTNGTFGDLDPAYEEATKGVYTAPGLFAAPYPFAQKDHFVDIVTDLLNIYREGIDNLKSNKDTRAELVEHRKELGQNLQERLTKAEAAVKDARSSNEQNWSENQKKARVAFSDLQALLVRTP